MAISLGNVFRNLINTVGSVVSTAADKVEQAAPEQWKPAVNQLRTQADHFVDAGAVSFAKPAPMTSAAAVKAEYAKDAKRDLTNPATLKQINAELKQAAPNAKPLTAAEVTAVIDATDIKLLPTSDYAKLKAAAGTGSRDNPATAVDAKNRGQLAKDGPVNLARSQLRANGLAGEPSTEQIEAARAELNRIDPGIFATPPKDVVYVNQKHVGDHGDPRQTKVASHELLHVILDQKGVPEGKDANGADVQHAIIGRLGWNQTFGTSGALIAGETANWNTPPGEGLPGQ